MTALGKHLNWLLGGKASSLKQAVSWCNYHSVAEPKFCIPLLLKRRHLGKKKAVQLQGGGEGTAQLCRFCMINGAVCRWSAHCLRVQAVLGAQLIYLVDQAFWCSGLAL